MIARDRLDCEFHRDPQRITPATILVVDDDPNMHGFLRVFLETRGHTVRTASSAADAIRQLRFCPVDAVVLDVKMPDGSGLDVLTFVRSKSKLRQLPILILTGAALTPEDELIVTSRRAYVFYKQENYLEEFAAYIDRLTQV